MPTRSVYRSVVRRVHRGIVRSNINVIDIDAQTFIDRVLADGGTVEDAGFLNSFVLDAKANNYWNDIVAAYSPSWGVKGGATASDLYSVTGATWDLAQSTGSAQPAINKNDLNGKTRLGFDGIQTAFAPKAFTYNQPETVINGGFEQESWTNSDGIYDGSTLNKMVLFQSAVTPGLRLFAGSLITQNNDAVLNTPRHIRALFNSTSSETQIDSGSIVSSDAGINNADGFTYGKIVSGAFAHFSDGMVILLNSTVDGNYSAKMTALYNFSKSSYGTS